MDGRKVIERKEGKDGGKETKERSMIRERKSQVPNKKGKTSGFKANDERNRIENPYGEEKNKKKIT